jgi:hypothetical protein
MLAALLNLEVALRLLHLTIVLVVIVVLLVRVFAHDLLLCACSLLFLLASARGFFLLLASSFSLSLLTLLALLLFLLNAELLVFFGFLGRLFFLFALLVGLHLSELLLALLLGNRGLLLVLAIVLALRLLCAFLAFFLRNAQDLHYVGRGVDAGGGGSEHLLQEEVGDFGLVTGDDLCRLAVDLLADNELSQLQQLDQPVDLGLLFSN